MKSETFRTKTIWIVFFCFVFSFCIYGPLSIFFSNEGEFWFSLPMIVAVIIPVSICVLFILFLIYILSLKKTKSNIFINLFFGIMIAMYLQGTFLNISYGSGVMDGTEINWNDYTAYSVINSLIWIICTSFPFGIEYMTRKKEGLYLKIIAGISLALIIIQVPALVFQIATYHPKKDDHFRITTKNIFEVSDSENIIVFILDTMDENYYQEFIDSNPEYVDELTGFIHYSNASTAGSRTILGIPAMFTGTPYRRESSYSEYLNSVWSKPNAFSILHDAGYRVDVYGEDKEYSADAAQYIDNFSGNTKDTINSYPLFAGKIYKMTLFKYAPHVAKKYFWYHSSEFEEVKSLQKDETEGYETYVLDDPAFYSKYREKGFHIQTRNDKVLQVYHLNGVHAPYCFNEKGEKDSGATKEQHIAGHFVLIMEMLEDLKQNDLYDNATILIVADHGDKHVGEHPMFLLKEKGAREPYFTSAAPVSYFDIPPYLASLAGRKLRNDYSEEMRLLQEDTVRKRHVFYNTSGNSRIIVEEYVSDGNAGDESSWVLIDQYDEIVSDQTAYDLGTDLSFGSDATGNRYTYEGFGDNTGWTTKLYGPFAELRIPIRQLPSKGNLQVTFRIKDRQANLNKSIIIEANDRIVFEGKTDDSVLRNGLIFPVSIETFNGSNVLDLKLRFPEIDSDEMQKKVEERTYAINLISMRIDAEP